MKPENLKAGQKFEALHSRKGTIIGIVKNNSDKEWITLHLLNKVKGLTTKWEIGEELTCRKSFLSSIKLLDSDAKKEKTFFPIDKWGKDHWSMLAYVETRAVDNRGDLDLRHIRVNKDKRGFSNGNFPNDKWNPEHATRLQNGKKPDPAHDDIDVMDDLKREGFLEYKSSCRNFVVTLTDRGNEVCAEVRQHKSAGKNFNEFKLSKQLA